MVRSVEVDERHATGSEAVVVVYLATGVTTGTAAAGGAGGMVALVISLYL